jgi:hypothetical protein
MNKFYLKYVLNISVSFISKFLEIYSIVTNRFDVISSKTTRLCHMYLFFSFNQKFCSCDKVSFLFSKNKELMAFLAKLEET